MSVLVFIEESRWVCPGTKEYYATVAGAALEEAAYDDFCRRILRLKERFFKRKELAGYPLRGRLLLNTRSLSAGYRKVEFVRELLSLCRQQKAVAFSTTKKFFERESQPYLPEAAGLLRTSTIVDSDKSSERTVSVLLAYLLERVNSYMLETHPGSLAKLVLKSEETQQDILRCSSVMNFFYRTPFGGGFHGLLGSPLLMPGALSPGLQIADLFAYLINRHHGGRKDLADIYAELEGMQFISMIEKDEYQLRGMNLLE